MLVSRDAALGPVGAGPGAPSFRAVCASAEVQLAREDRSQSALCRGHLGRAAGTLIRAPGPGPEPPTTALVCHKAGVRGGVRGARRWLSPSQAGPAVADAPPPPE